MVIFNTAMLDDIKSEMVSSCLGANVEVVIDCGNKAVYLQWHHWQNLEFVLSRQVDFADVDAGRIDVLKLQAQIGSKQFAREVSKLLKEKGL